MAGFVIFANESAFFRQWEWSIVQNLPRNVPVPRRIGFETRFFNLWRPRIEFEPRRNVLEPSRNVPDATRKRFYQPFFGNKQRVREAKQRVRNSKHGVACHTVRVREINNVSAKINTVSAVQNTVSAVLYMVSAI